MALASNIIQKCFSQVKNFPPDITEYNRALTKYFLYMSLLVWCPPS